MKINTVSILETIDGEPRKLASFNDNEEGNKAAENLFKKICAENSVPESDIPICIENGSAPDTKGSSWNLYIIHSE